MLAAAGLVVALLSPAPADAPGPEPGDETGERGTIVIDCFVPESDDEGALMLPGGVAVGWWRRPGPQLEVYVRTSFVAILADRSAGM